jgi:rhodanese-related sulfurtransferase
MPLLPRAAALTLAAVLAVAGLGACSSSSDAVTDVSVAESADVLAGSDVVVIDVRTPAEFESGHLADAVNIDIESGTFDTDVAELEKDGTYVVYCRSGNRSGVATEKMAELGFTDVYNLEGGVTDWVAAGGALVTG